MKNQLPQVFWLTGAVMLLLVGLLFLPEHLSIGAFKLRKMDIFSDLRPKTAVPVAAIPPIDTLQIDTVSTPVDSASLTLQTVDSSRAFGPLPRVDSAFFGRMIEDYTPEQAGLSTFFEAVDSIQSRRRTVRVAFYGDSFVEGDILIGDLRDTLQSLWGGNGVGFVPITSEVARFKRTLKHDFRGWTSHSIVKKSAARPPLGINGFAYVPDAGAKVHYEGADYFNHTRRWGRFKLFYTAGSDCRMIWQNKDAPPQMATLNATDGVLKTWEWAAPEGGIRAFAISFPEPQGLRLYGATLDDGPGFYIDNFSVRGNTGRPLTLLHPDFIRQFDAQLQYNLVVVQLGLNAVTNGLDNIRWYRAELDKTFAHLRACFPDKPILVVSVGDRGGKIDAEFATMYSVPFIVEMQRDLARKHGFLFYDLFHAMGGPGTMIRFANRRPMLANKDFTHLTHAGGRVVGHLFASLFLQEQAKYKRRGER
jgi:GDSL-like Lipase/Acylhydrolase family